MANCNQRCFLKIRDVSGDFYELFTGSRLNSHFEFIRNTLPSKIIKDAILPIHYVAQIADDAIISQSDERAAEKVVQRIQRERNKIAHYLEYFDRYLAGDRVWAEQLQSPSSSSLT